MESGALIPASGPGKREVQPAFALPFSQPMAAHAPFPLQGHDSLAREYLRVLLKRKWVIFGSVAIIFAVVAISTLRSQPIYDAVGSIAINKVDPVTISFKDSGNAGVDYYDPTDMDTEVRILRSDLLALQVIKQLNLDKPYATAGKPASSLPDLTSDAMASDSAGTASALANFKGSLQVTLIPNTRIIEIHYRSPDKNLAARVVNTLSNTYVEQNFKTRFESTMQASDWLSKQLVDLQIKVETSQEKLVKYQKEHEILGSDEKQNITTAKLDALNQELTGAESSRMDRESIYRLAQSGDLEPLSASAAGNSEGAKTSVSVSSLLDKLREQQADLNIQASQLSTQFGPSFPKVAQLNSQLKEVESQIQLEKKKIAARVRSDYFAALQRENLLRGALERQKQEANKLNESAIEYSLLKRDVESNRTLYEGLLEKLKEAGVTAGLRSNNFRVVDVARVPTAPSEPNLPRNLSLALALGLTTGIGLAFALESLDNTVRTPEQTQAISGLPSLGMIPLGSKLGADHGAGRRLSVARSREAVELVTQSRPQSQMAESYRALRTSLLLTSVGGPPKIILITSALPQEGKTTTSINSAIVLAQRGTRVLLVDADLRRPSIHKTLGMGPRAGLSNVLTGNATLEQAIIRSTILPSLFVLPAGTPPPNPAELLASSNMRDVLTELREQYDHIVIDTPPTLSVTDAVVLSPSADSVVLVIRSGQTTKQALRRAREILTQVSSRLSGVLLNAVDLKSPDYYYYYEYQGKYGGQYYREDIMSEQADTAPMAASSGA
jgi:succinoglycan biosynthesis transport protein ExoP